ncbi:MAG TPA: ATP-binding protein [Methylomirabilota bacterium]|nr:ATP-binding protein [Methylomirabilota bacterium]
MRVLVVEDDERLCEVFRDYLLQLGHEPLVVRTAEAALAVLQETRPAVMLLDIHLPGMSGLDFLRLQGTRGLHVPIVVMSGGLNAGEADDCLRLGAVDYLGKPIALDHLRDVLSCLQPLAETPTTGPSTRERTDVGGHPFHFLNLSTPQQERVQSLVAPPAIPPTASDAHARVLHSITQAFGGALDLDETLRLVLHALTHVTGHETSSLHLLSSDGAWLHLRSERGLSPRLREINRVLPVGEGVIGRVAATGRTARTANVTASPDLLSAARTTVETDGVRGFVCVPLQTRGRVIGTLSLGRSTPEPFSDNEVALLEASANQLSLALDNARLVAETRRQLEDLQHSQANAAEHQRLSTVGKLAAGLAHEINNPLTAILGQAHLLMRAAEHSPETRERLGVIIQETSRAARLLKSVLTLSRSHTTERSDCSLDAEVRMLLQLTQPQRDLAGIRTIAELDPVPPVRANADQMRQVVLNLLQNAHQAMAGNAGEHALTVSTRVTEDRVLVQVLDTGPGMPPDVLPRVFDAFFTTKKNEQGTGLGLWVSYDIVEQHGGRLTANNRPEGGAIFTMELPRTVNR